MPIFIETLLFFNTAYIVRIGKNAYLWFSQNNAYETSYPAHFALRIHYERMRRSARIFQAERLVEALEKGELCGKLKEVAQTLTYDDNPVLMLVRYK